MPMDSLQKLNLSPGRKSSTPLSNAKKLRVDAEPIGNRLRPRQESSKKIPQNESSSSNEEPIGRRLRSRKDKTIQQQHQPPQAEDTTSSSSSSYDDHNKNKKKESIYEELRQNSLQKKKKIRRKCESSSDKKTVVRRLRPRQSTEQQSSDEEPIGRRLRPRQGTQQRRSTSDQSNSNIVYNNDNSTRAIGRRLRRRAIASSENESSTHNEPIGSRLRPRRTVMKLDHTSEEKQDEEPLIITRDRRISSSNHDQKHFVKKRCRELIQSSSSSETSSREEMEVSSKQKIFSKQQALNITRPRSAVAGLASQRAMVEELVLVPLKYPQLVSRLGVRPARGLLFWGPPGTGKTLLAREIARESGLSFLARQGGELLSKYVGEAEKALSQLFTEAKQKAPCVLFFDEIDGLAPARRSETHQHVSVVTTLLALLDGLEDRGNVVVIAATNRIEAIDPALRRPGRLDKEVFFPPPNEEERAAILSLHASTWDPPPASALIGRLAARTNGFTGAELKALCDDAATLALRRQRPQLFTWSSSSNGSIANTAATVFISQEQNDVVQVTARDLESALSTRGNMRRSTCTDVQCQPLSAASAKLYGAFLEELNQVLEDTSDQNLPIVIRIRGSSRTALAIVAGAVFSKLGGQPIIDIGHAALLRHESVTLESALAARIAAARNGSLFAPDADRLWRHATNEFKVAMHALLRDSPPNVPIVTTQFIEDDIENQNMNDILWDLCPVLLALDLDEERADRCGYFRLVLSDILSALRACPQSSIKFNHGKTSYDERRNPQFLDEDDEEELDDHIFIDKNRILDLDTQLVKATNHLNVHALELWTHTQLWPLVDGQLAAWPEPLDIPALLESIQKAAVHSTSFSSASAQ